MANLVLKHEFISVMSLTLPQYLVMTLEGHAHEAMLIQVRNERFKTTTIIGYQHAPIVPGQLSIFQVASLFKSQDFFLTSGKRSKISALAKNLNCKIGVLGSTKSHEYELGVKSIQKIRVVITPEATKRTIFQLADLTVSISHMLPNFEFIFRPHPDTKHKTLRIISRKLNPLHNVELSQVSLQEDLRNAHFIIFRSSAVAIQSLSFGVYPIHFNSNSDNSLNPLSEDSEFCKSVSSPIDLANFIKDYDLSYFQNSRFRESCFQIFNCYFEPMKNLDFLLQ